MALTWGTIRIFAVRNAYPNVPDYLTTSLPEVNAAQNVWGFG